MRDLMLELRVQFLQQFIKQSLQRKENVSTLEQVNGLEKHKQMLTFKMISGGIQLTSNSYSFPRTSNNLHEEMH